MIFLKCYHFLVYQPFSFRISAIFCLVLKRSILGILSHAGGACGGYPPPALRPLGSVNAGRVDSGNSTVTVVTDSLQYPGNSVFVSLRHETIRPSYVVTDDLKTPATQKRFTSTPRNVTGTCTSTGTPTRSPPMNARAAKQWCLAPQSARHFIDPLDWPRTM